MFKTRSNTPVGRITQDVLSLTNEPVSWNVSSDRGKLILKYYPQVPAELKKWSYDAVIIHCQKDIKSATSYLKQLSKETLISKHKIKPILLLDLKRIELSIENDFFWVIERCSFIFLYVTKHFCHDEDGWKQIAEEKWIKEAINRKICVLINFSREALPSKLQSLPKITHGGNIDEDVDQIKAMLLPTAQRRLHKDKECKNKIWDYINKFCLNSSSSSDDDIYPESSKKQLLESGIGESLESSQNIFSSLQSVEGDTYPLEQIDASRVVQNSYHSKDSGFGREFAESLENEADDFPDSVCRVSKDPMSSKQRSRQHSGKSYKGVPIKTVIHKHREKNTTIYEHGAGVSTRLTQSNGTRTRSLKDQNVQSKNTLPLKDRGKDERKHTNIYILYDRHQQSMEECHKSNKQNCTYTENVPFGIQESCSQNNDPPTVLISGHQTPLREYAFDGSQQQKPEKYSGKVEVSSASESLKRKPSPQNTNDTKTGTGRPVSTSEFSDNQESSTQTIYGLENHEVDTDYEFGNIPKKHMVKDGKFCDNDMEKKTYNDSQGLSLPALLFGKDVQSDSVQHSTSQTTSRQSSTSEESNYSENEETYENKFKGV